MKKGDRVRVLGCKEGFDIIGTIAVNKLHLPYPFLVEVDLEESILTEQLKDYYKDHYCGPFKAEDLEIL